MFVFSCILENNTLPDYSTPNRSHNCSLGPRIKTTLGKPYIELCHSLIIDSFVGIKIRNRPYTPVSRSITTGNYEQQRLTANGQLLEGKIFVVFGGLIFQQESVFHWILSVHHFWLICICNHMQYLHKGKTKKQLVMFFFAMLLSVNFRLMDVLFICFFSFPKFFLNSLSDAVLSLVYPNFRACLYLIYPSELDIKDITDRRMSAAFLIFSVDIDTDGRL